MLKVRRSALYEFWFRYYARRQFQNHFHRVRTFGTSTLADMNLDMNLDTPVIFYMNHAYWWDGFWSQLLTETYFTQNLYIIIEYKQLVRYQFFTRLGAFSIVRENPRDAIETITYAAEKLCDPSPKQNALWIFPQGTIEPVDKRPLSFFNGTSKIIEKVLEKKSSLYLCSAVTRIEYFGDQKPELLISFEPYRLVTRETFSNAKTLTLEMQTATEVHLDNLKQRVLTKDFTSSEILVEGRRSINERWDSFRKKIGLGTS
jgi:chlorobactene lauroyltransferase